MLGTYLWMIVIAFWGYIADFGFRALRGRASRPYWRSFLLDLPGATFFGIMTYYVGKSAGLDEWLLGALVGTAGHIGGRGIYQFEAYLIDRLNLDKWKPVEEDRHKGE
jgi:hypothetical protein